MGVAAVVCAVALLAGCADWRRPSPPRHVSLKDDTPQPEKPGASVEDRARREQAEWCGQRHLQHSAGTLNESEEQKRARDDQCSELHKRDYVQ
jgi:hypothetical protein